MYSNDATSSDALNTLGFKIKRFSNLHGSARSFWFRLEVFFHNFDISKWSDQLQGFGSKNHEVNTQRDVGRP